MRKLQYVAYLALYFWNGSAYANDGGYFDAFISAEISQCEMRNLQRYWKLSDEYETKVAIGNKVLAKKDLVADIQNARKMALAAGEGDCDFWKLDFSYSDAETMASYWNTDTYDAKMKIAQYAAETSQLTVKNLIKKSQSKSKTSTDPIDAFFAGGYDYCHALMVGNAYGKSSYETKIWLGNILLGNDKQLVELKLDYGRSEAQKDPNKACRFGDTNFTYADAEKLGKMWKISTDEAKATLANKYTWGSEKDVMRMLR